MLTVHMIGNAHLDPVWLWRWQQGAVERRMHATERPVEWPVQGWSKMMLSQEYEVALVTNDAYSVS